MTQVTTATNAETCAKEFAVLQHLLPTAMQVVGLNQSFQVLLRDTLSRAFNLQMT
jgi:hypothetical protein